MMKDQLKNVRLLDGNAFQGYRLERCADLILVPDTEKGRGVFATASIAKGTIIEMCPVLVLDKRDVEQHTKHTEMNHYTYNWQQSQAVVFGLGSMFNHSRNHQNVMFERDLERQIVTYRALRDIAPGEELCISYGDRLTFKDTEVSDEKEEQTEDFIGKIQLQA